MTASVTKTAADAQSPWLNAARALAAWVVCFAHLRAFFLVDFEQSGSGFPGRLFYFGTGLHHQAVMVFFVLSGYFVGGALLREAGSGTINLKLYAMKRATRLWMVLIPTLLLTLFWDRLGIALAGSPPYQGAFLDILSSGPAPEAPADHSLLAFLGNVFFLQTILVPAYGSNGPLWSLANEGWYYLLFPLAVLALVARTVRIRALCAVVFLALVAALLVWQAEILVLGCNWLFGVFMAWLNARPAMSSVTRTLAWRVTTLCLFCGTLAVSRLGFWLGHDLLVGLAFALCVTWLAGATMPFAPARKAAFVCADFSYTLYLTHFPLLGFLFFVIMRGDQLPFAGQSLVILGLLFALCLAFAWLIWWCFERNTDWLRRRLLRMVRARDEKHG